MTNRLFCGRIPLVKFGGVAHLGERSVRNAEVEGSIPFVSIMQKDTAQVSFCVMLALWNGIEAALRKRSGGSVFSGDRRFLQGTRKQVCTNCLAKIKKIPFVSFTRRVVEDADPYRTRKLIYVVLRPSGGVRIQLTDIRL